MNLTSPSAVKSLLEKHNLSPSKHFGQNFLIDKNILDKIIAAAELSKNDVVIEVGPGLGVLTQELAGHAKKVIAIEKDKKMLAILREVVGTRRGASLSAIEIINADILHFKLPKVGPSEKYKIVANLPYYITSRAIRRFLEYPNPPEKIVLMVQKEVAERIISTPPNMSLLSVAVQFYAKPKILAKVSKNSFWPAPKVDSAIIAITPHERPKINTDSFFTLVRVGFSGKRKQLIHNIIKNFKIERDLIEEIFAKINLNLKIRAQELSIEQWITLLQEMERYNIISSNRLSGD